MYSGAAVLSWLSSSCSEKGEENSEEEGGGAGGVQAAQPAGRVVDVDVAALEPPL